LISNPARCVMGMLFPCSILCILIDLQTATCHLKYEFWRNDALCVIDRATFNRRRCDFYKNVTIAT